MNVMQNQQAIIGDGLFQGTREQIRNFLKSNPGRYYVYILRRPDLRPFYVGKGKAYRLFNHVNEARHTENSHKLNVIRSIKSSGSEVIYEIFKTDSRRRLSYKPYRRWRRRLGPISGIARKAPSDA